MSATLWTNIYFRITVTWFNLLALLSILSYHSYRLCHLQRDRKGSPLKLFKCISFRHLSFVVIISSILPALQQAITYTPMQYLSDQTCRFTVIFGMVCLAFSKLALHLFVTMRSQVATATTNIWYKLGLIMSLSDVLWIVYILSGIPNITATQNSVLCKVKDAPLHIYIWFAMNDFVIGIYCLLAFILPLRKYVWLEHQQSCTDSIRSIDIQTQKKQKTDLRAITMRIMVYSSVALFSTMAITAIASVANESGGVLFALDSTINALCVTLQFATESDTLFMSCKCPTRVAIASISEIEPEGECAATRKRKYKLEVIIHPAPPQIEKAATNKPTLKGNKSLSVSIVANDAIEIK